MTRIKGKIFPSFLNPGSGSGRSGKAGPHRALPEGMQYTGGSGRKASTRYLKQACHPVLKSKDPAISLAVNLASEAIPNEYLLYQFIHKAMKVSTEKGVSLIESMNQLLEKFEELKPKAAQSEASSDGSKDGKIDETTVVGPNS